MVNLNWHSILLKVRHEAEKAGIVIGQNSLKYSSTARLRWQGILFSFLAVGGGTLLLLLLDLAPYNVNMVFMLLTIVATAWFGLGTGVLTALLAFFCFDYFFIPPFFTLVIDAGQGWTAIFLFLGTALFANQVAGRAREGNQQAQFRAREATALYDLATAVITKIDQTEMLMLVLRKVRETLNTTSCTLFLADETRNGQLVETTRIEKIEHGLEDAAAFIHQPELSMAQAVFNQNRATFLPGLLTDFNGSDESGRPPSGLEPSGSSRLEINGSIAYVPLTYGSERLGVLCLAGWRGSDESEDTSERVRLIQVFANHVALAVEHTRLIREAAQVAALRDSDKLKSALLASVSHELRTPLTAIKTAAANLRSVNPNVPEEETSEIVNIIEQETDRLTRLVSDMLDLSKIEAHALQPNFGWYYLPEIVSKVIKRLRQNRVIGSHTITTSFAPDLPLVQVDFVQIDQVLTNLIENAAKYSAPKTNIAVQVECVSLAKLEGLSPGRNFSLFNGENDPDRDKDTDRQVLAVKVLDEGETIPQSEFERIFDKFYRLPTSPTNGPNIPGTGLGLAISKGIIEAHSGAIWVQHRLYGGNVFTFVLPVAPLDEFLEILETEEV